MKLQENCNLCGRPLVLVHTWTLDLRSTNDVTVKQKIKTYKCGHFQVMDILDISVDSLIVDSLDKTKSLRDYQKDGVKFIMDANYNAIIGDQMRLGKTPQALMALRQDLANRTPCLIIVRSTNAM